jgi:serine/threonine protein kinase
MTNGLPYDFQVDIWSLGIVAYEMVTSHSPFAGSEDIIENIKNFSGFNSIKDNLDNVCASDELKDFISQVIAYDPNKRLCVEDVLNHPWLNLYN